MPAILWLAAVYNVLAGVTVVAVPDAVFQQAQMATPEHGEFFQAIAAVGVAIGVGYGLAATSPIRHWPLVLIGLLSKLAVLATLATPIIQGKLSSHFAWMIGISHGAWLIPFSLILFGVWRVHHPRQASLDETPSPASTTTPSVANGDFAPDAPVGTDAYRAAEAAALGSVTRAAQLHRGHMLTALSLRELSDKSPTLLVFLRHLGCTFCREALADIAANRKAIESKGITIVLVHMTHPTKAAKFFERYGLDQPEQIWHASDPQRRLYRAFELPRATLGKVLGFAELGRGFKAGILKGHMIGLPQGGDTRQLGGAVLFYKRRVFRAFRPVRAAERPDYVGVSSCKIDLEPPPAPAAAAPREARSNR